MSPVPYATAEAFSAALPLGRESVAQTRPTDHLLRPQNPHHNRRWIGSV